MSTYASHYARLVSRVMLPRKKYKPGLDPKNLIPPKRWTILRGDNVAVIDGPEKGKRGIVQAVIRKQNRVIVEGVNMHRVLQKIPGQEKGSMMMRPGAIHVSNVHLVCPETNEPTRVARRFLDDGTKVRVSKRSGAVIPRPAVLMERRNPRRVLAGSKDTPQDAVSEVTFRGLDANGREIT
ncbi:unnamed protein product [Phaeothamnion confervicola]